MTYFNIPFIFALLLFYLAWYGKIIIQAVKRGPGKKKGHPSKNLQLFKDGILGHQGDKRLESFALCFTENHTLLWF
jgi:hypothetical protein